MSKHIKSELARRELARRELLPYICYMKPDYKVGWFHKQLSEIMDAFVEAVNRKGSPRIILSVAPRVGKSTAVSEYLPTYILGKNPKAEIVAATYNQDLANSFGRKVRDILQNPQYLDLFNVELDTQAQSVSYVRLSKGGSYYAVGAGGSLTGRGADCVPGWTRVLTSEGERRVDELYKCSSSVKVWAYDHKQNRTRFAPVQAICNRKADGVYRITTASGRVVEATGNHRIYTGRGYVRADELTPGDSLLCAMPENSSTPGVRGFQSHTQRAESRVLFQQVLGGCGKRKTPSAAFVRLRCKNTFLSKNVQTVSYTSKRITKSRDYSQKNPTVFGMQQAFYSLLENSDVLFSPMLRSATFAENASREQSRLAKRSVSRAAKRACCKSFQIRQTRNNGTGWEVLRGVRRYRTFARTPYRYGCHQQQVQQSRDVVLKLPLKASRGRSRETTPDIVRMVEYVRGTTLVYDIQVLGCENFFANGVLVHNCLIIDDPVKDREAADSPIESEKLWEWYSSTARTRMLPGGGIIIVMTRWATDDLAGRLIDQANRDPDADQWKIINFPALAEQDEDFRKKGEALHPERYDRDAYLRIKASIQPRDWASLYCGKPYVEGGNFFSQDTVRYYKDKPAELTWLIGVDYATSASKKSDKSAIVPMGVDYEGNVYIGEDFFYDNVDPWDAVVRTIALAKQYEARDLAGESGPIQNTMGPIFSRVQEEQHWYVTVSKNVRRSSKAVASLGMKALMFNGKLHFPDTPRMRNEIIPELLAFDPKVDRGGDDFIDGIVNGCLLIESIGRPLPPAPPPPKWRTDPGAVYGADVFKKKKGGSATIPGLRSNKW